MIRAATQADVPALVKLALELVAESPTFATIPFNSSKTHDYLSWLVESAHGIIVVAEKRGEIIGAIAGGVDEQPFSYELYAWETGLFIRKSHRGGLLAVKLILAFEERAKELGALEFRPGVMTGINVERTTRLYEHLGYTLTGSQLVKRWQTL